MFVENHFLSYPTKITKLCKDIENLSCYGTQKHLLDKPTLIDCLNSTAFAAFDVFQDRDKKRCVKQIFLGVVARQIFNVFAQFGDFHGNTIIC